jgi:rSAM/selenodomain-associated transferase 2
MHISIVIPVLNEAETIGPLLQYLFAHGRGQIMEILVVDGGSTDGTLCIVEKSGATVLHSEVRSRAAQMNLGARQAQGDVLYFIHADTYPPASFTGDIETSLAAGHVMGCYRYRFNSRSVLLKINAYFNRFHWLCCQGGDKTFYIRREVFQQLGGYDEYYTIMEEYDFLRRAMSLYSLHIIPKYAVVSARKYQHNSWLRVQYANALVFRLFRKGASPELMKKTYTSIVNREL